MLTESQIEELLNKDTPVDGNGTEIPFELISELAQRYAFLTGARSASKTGDYRFVERFSPGAMGKSEYAVYPELLTSNNQLGELWDKAKEWGKSGLANPEVPRDLLLNTKQNRLSEVQGTGDFEGRMVPSDRHQLLIDYCRNAGPENKKTYCIEQTLGQQRSNARMGHLDGEMRNTVGRNNLNKRESFKPVTSRNNSIKYMNSSRAQYQENLRSSSNGAKSGREGRNRLAKQARKKKSTLFNKVNGINSSTNGYSDKIENADAKDYFKGSRGGSRRRVYGKSRRGRSKKGSGKRGHSRRVRR